jgi:hypothetical protein
MQLLPGILLSLLCVLVLLCVTAFVVAFVINFFHFCNYCESAADAFYKKRRLELSDNGRGLLTAIRPEAASGEKTILD